MGLLTSAYLFSLIVGGFFVALSVFAGLGEADADLEGADIDADVDADFDADVAADVDGDISAADLDASDLDLSEFDGDMETATQAAEMAVDAQTGGLGDGVDLGVGSDIDPGQLDLASTNIDFDLDADGDASVGETAVSRQRSFNPFVSFKFYTFFLAFFGLTGFLFEWANLWSSSAGIFVLSVAMGSFAGLSIAYLMHWGQSGPSGGIKMHDYLGAHAEVNVGISTNQFGKVELTIDGKTIEMLAASADGNDYEIGDECFVIGIEDNTLQVISAKTVYDQLGTKDDTGGQDVTLESSGESPSGDAAEATVEAEEIEESSGR